MGAGWFGVVMSSNEVDVNLDDMSRRRPMNENAQGAHRRGLGTHEWEMERTSVYLGTAHLPTADAADVTKNRRTMMVVIIAFGWLHLVSWMDQRGRPISLHVGNELLGVCAQFCWLVGFRLISVS